jgi:hypothetical protein
VPPLEAGRIYLLLDLLSGAPTVAPETRHDWDVLLRELRELRRQKMTAQARGEPLLARPSVPRFFLADELQREGNPAALIDAEEEWRAAALSYWLATTRPRLPDQTRARLAEELDEEEHDIETLRGAYFEMLFRTLPEHYHRFAFEMNTAAWDPPKPSFERGRRKSVEVLARLSALRERMAAREPSYSAVRPDGPSGFTVLQELLGRHRRGTASIV